jgi:hypothetical protein
MLEKYGENKPIPMSLANFMTVLILINEKIVYF